VLNGSRRVVISIVHESFLGFDLVKQLVTESITCNLPPQSRLIGHCPYSRCSFHPLLWSQCDTTLQKIDLHTADPKVLGEKIVNNFVTSCQTKETQKKITISEPNNIFPEPFNIFPKQPVTVVPMRPTLHKSTRRTMMQSVLNIAVIFAFALADKSVTSLDIV
jgi:hypothetical protein